MNPYRTGGPLRILAPLKHGRFESLRQQPPPPPLDAPAVLDARIVKTGFDPTTCHSNFQMESFIRRRDLCHAVRLFDQMPHRNTFSVNTLISGCVKSGDVARARELFDRLLDPNAVSWTILIGGYAKHNQPREAFKLFTEMQRRGTPPDYVTFVALLSGCDGPETMSYVIQLHGILFKSGFGAALVVCNSLLVCYCKSSRLVLARKVFDEMRDRDCVTFNAMISGYANHRFGGEESMRLFTEMRTLGFIPSEFTVVAVLCADHGPDDMVLGQQVHVFAVKTGLVSSQFVGNALLHSYSKQDAADGRKLFDEMPEPDGVSYNVIITAYAWRGRLRESFHLFRELQISGLETRRCPLPTLLSLAANAQHLELGRQIHSHAVVTTSDSEVLVGSSLVDMYAKCGRFEAAARVFTDLDHRIGGCGGVPWTAMISGYVQHGFPEESLKVFNRMCRASVAADEAALVSAVQASANLASPSSGRQLHSRIIRSGFVSNVICGGAVVDMYAKCGAVGDAVRVFREMQYRNSVCWNTLISAHAQDGNGEAAMESFQEMLASGFRPDAVSFLSVITACGRCGLIEEGIRCFSSMAPVYGIVPGREHYAAAVDTLCRGGRFDEARRLMREMPFDAGEVVWSSVLSSCRIHKKREAAMEAADRLFGMGLRDGSGFVNLSSVYAAAGEWESAGMAKKAMREQGARKAAGYSWVESRDGVQVFSANDRSHPQIGAIMAQMEGLAAEMEAAGYRADSSCGLHEEEERLALIS